MTERVLAHILREASKEMRVLITVNKSSDISGA